jgi:glutaredoxin
MIFENVDGKDRGKIVLYALSTCVWCKKTRKLLDKIGVGYSYVYVDLLYKNEMRKVIDDIKRYNPSCSFPTMIIDGKKCIVGYREKEIKEALRS